jgi:Protein of unknown function (DUF2934)
MAKKTGKTQDEISTTNGDRQAKAPRTRARRPTTKTAEKNVETVGGAAESVTAFASGTVGATDYSTHELAHDSSTESETGELATGPSEDQIRFRAYQHFLERGRLHGADFDDWLQAERELRRR